MERGAAQQNKNLSEELKQSLSRQSWGLITESTFLLSGQLHSHFYALQKGSNIRFYLYFTAIF